MTKHTCPNCQHSFEVKPVKKAVAQITELRNGAVYYGKMVNYSDGPRMAFASSPDDGKPRRFSKNMIKLIEARAKGLYGKMSDWLAQYPAHIDRDYYTAYNAIMAALPDELYYEAEREDRAFDRERDNDPTGT